MLYKQTVNTTLLELTQQLCFHPAMQNFVLVGGTALSLQIGHRKSIDIDMFSEQPFDAEELSLILKNSFNFYANNRFKNALMGTIQDIKTDVITHQYKWIRPLLDEEGIRMASLEDIAAMKLNAIAGNGSRLKDFVDIAFLSSCFSLQQMLDFFEEKYPNNNSVIALKSLCYFDDIIFDVDILYQDSPLSWEIIKSRIIAMVQEPQKVFSKL